MNLYLTLSIVCLVGSAALNYISVRKIDHLKRKYQVTTFFIKKSDYQDNPELKEQLRKALIYRYTALLLLLVFIVMFFL